MLDEHSYHCYQCSYRVINRVIIIASHGLRAGAAQRDSLAQPGIVLGALHQFGGPPRKKFHTATSVTGRDFDCRVVIKHS